jgi:hypothetical protein
VTQLTYCPAKPFFSTQKACLNLTLLTGRFARLKTEKFSLVSRGQVRLGCTVVVCIEFRNTSSLTFDMEKAHSAAGDDAGGVHQASPPIIARMG